MPFAGWVRYVIMMKSERKEGSLREQKENLEEAESKIESLESQLQTLKNQNAQVSQGRAGLSFDQ